MKNKGLLVFEKCDFCKKRNAKFKIEQPVNLLICEHCRKAYRESVKAVFREPIAKLNEK
jgi:hypothetical protein